MSFTVNNREKSPFPKYQLLDVQISATAPLAAVNKILEWVEKRAKRSVCVFAVDSLLQCHKNSRLAEIANSVSMTLPDGMPLVWLGRLLARLPVKRCYGPDLMLQTIAAGCDRGVKHFFYGGADSDVTANLKLRLLERFPTLQVVGQHAPPHRELTPAERDAIAEEINASGADIVWVGIGTPKQDYWVGEFRPLLDASVLIAVGAAFDFHSGKVRQAPRWMMRIGLEWFFRLLMEPGRLWRRYLLGNPRFVALILRQWITGKPKRLGMVTDPDTSVG